MADVLVVPPREVRGAATFAALTLFLSAVLLFSVQPLVARLVLPLLGGVPSVWVTCVMFYQVLLLAGYLWAHLLSTRVTLRTQAFLHVALIAVSLGLQIPLTLRGGAPSPDVQPALWIVTMLTLSVALPFLALSTTAPLLQAWLAKSGCLTRADDAYSLYRSSNAGSAAGLLAYPLVAEPLLTLAGQRMVWSGLYAGYAGMILLAAVVLSRIPQAGAHRVAGAVAGSAAATPLRCSAILRWVLLAAVPSSLMLGTTTFITTDLASVPMLWVLPLLLYLLSFVATFGPSPIVRRSHVRAILPISLLITTVLYLFGVRSPWWLLMGPHLLNLFVAALACHGELAAGRPEPDRLTHFYLALAVGGALGGLFNSVVAPLVFDRITEYPMALVLASAALPWAYGSTRKDRLFDVELPFGVGALTVTLIVAVKRLLPAGMPSALLMFGAPAYWCWRFRHRALRFGLGLSAMIAAQMLVFPEQTRTLHVERNFFGILRVTSSFDGRLHSLNHGSTLHGRQDFALSRRTVPLSYYHAGGPVDDVFSLLERAPGEAVAVAGLGAGTLAVYSRAGEHWTFYEIDPAVVRVARDPELFTFLGDAPARMDVVVGDARLMLAKAPHGRYGIIVLDAFSSDAVPVHLLTREALQMYLQKLRPEGILVFNISNRYLTLDPLLGSLAADAGLAALGREYATNGRDRRRGWSSSQWVVMARDSGRLDPLRTMGRWTALPEGPRVWTDDYANVLGLLGTKLPDPARRRPSPVEGTKAHLTGVAGPAR